MGKRVQEEPGQESRQALTTLLATEQELDARIAAAREEAQRIVADGVEAARHAEEEVPALVEARIAALRSAIEAQLLHDLAKVEQDAHHTIARFESIDPQRTPDLVALLVSRVLTVGSEATR